MDSVLKSNDINTQDFGKNFAGLSLLFGISGVAFGIFGIIFTFSFNILSDNVLINSFMTAFISITYLCIILASATPSIVGIILAIKSGDKSKMSGLSRGIIAKVGFLCSIIGSAIGVTEFMLYIAFNTINSFNMLIL